MSNTNIKFLAFAKASASLPIYSISPEKQLQEDLKIQIGKVLIQLKGLGLRQDERQKINTSNGCWYCKKDNRQFVYAILCSANYPERHAYAAINQLRQHLLKLGNYQTEPQSSLKIHAKPTMQQICRKYQNLKNFDKIAMANQNVIELRETISESTRKMLDNQIQLEDLQKKSQTLKDHANQFSQSAGQLQKIMYWRNCKLKIVIGLVIICLLCYIIIPIATKK